MRSSGSWIEKVRVAVRASKLHEKCGKANTVWGGLTTKRAKNMRWKSISLRSKYKRKCGVSAKAEVK